MIAEADVKLHDIIVHAAGNERLTEILNNLSEQMYRYRFEYIKDTNNYEKLVEEHRIIYESILNKDKQTAAQTARVHIDNQERSILNLLRSE